MTKTAVAVLILLATGITLGIGILVGIQIAGRKPPEGHPSSALGPPLGQSSPAAQPAFNPQAQVYRAPAPAPIVRQMRTALPQESQQDEIRRIANQSIYQRQLDRAQERASFQSALAQHQTEQEQVREQERQRSDQIRRESIERQRQEDFTRLVADANEYNTLLARLADTRAANLQAALSGQAMGDAVGGGRRRGNFSRRVNYGTMRDSDVERLGHLHDEVLPGNPLCREFVHETGLAFPRGPLSTDRFATYRFIEIRQR